MALGSHAHRTHGRSHGFGHGRLVLPPPIPPQARSAMGPRIEGGHDHVGTGPECARPRPLRLGDSRRGRSAGGQRKSERASERSESAAARAHEGKPVVEILNAEKARIVTTWCEGVWDRDMGIGKGHLEAKLERSA